MKRALILQAIIVVVVISGMRAQRVESLVKAPSVSGYSQSFFSNACGRTISPRSSAYLTPWSSAPSVDQVWLSDIIAASQNGQWFAPITGTVKNLVITTITSQDSSGSLDVEVESCSPTSGLCTGVGTGVSIVIPAGQAAGLFRNMSATYLTSAGNYIDLKITNNATTSSAAIAAWSFVVSN